MRYDKEKLEADVREAAKSVLRRVDDEMNGKGMVGCRFVVFAENNRVTITAWDIPGENVIEDFLVEQDCPNDFYALYLRTELERMMVTSYALEEIGCYVNHVAARNWRLSIR